MKNKNIVTIGGGTGGFTLLSGLKKYPLNISAIVSMADDGGSTGVLRDELGVLPPGDIRQCLVALSESPLIIRNLFNYRFDAGGLRGHSFGNLFLSALEKISGGFQDAVDKAGETLNIKGQVISVTETDVNLVMKLRNGKILSGEDEINHDFSIQKTGIKEIFLKPKAMVNPRAVKAILGADAIVIGPGNFYCSLIPNLLIKEIASAIRRSDGLVVHVSNLVNKKGHTEKFKVDDYVKEVEKYIGKGRIDYVIYNSEKPTESLVKNYARQSGEIVGFDRNQKSGKYRVLKAKILSHKIHKYNKADSITEIRALIRHDSDRLAKAIMFILDLKENKNVIGEII